MPYKATLEMEANNYLVQTGLGGITVDFDVEKIANDAISDVREAFNKQEVFYNEDSVRELYEYKVPKLGPGGSCRLVSILIEIINDVHIRISKYAWCL